MVVICLCAVADRFHGYLRSVMLNVHPGVFLSMDLDAGTRQRVFQTVEACCGMTASRRTKPQETRLPAWGW
jgi:hypothetical protein